MTQAIHSLCMDRDRSPVTVRSFRAADIPPGKRIAIRKAKDMLCETKTDTPANSVSVAFHHSLNCFSVSANATAPGSLLSASAARCDAFTKAICLASSNGNSGRCAVDTCSI